jgi:hypothetical protein
LAGKHPCVSGGAQPRWSWHVVDLRRDFDRATCRVQAPARRIRHARRRTDQSHAQVLEVRRLHAPLIQVRTTGD